MTNQPEHLDHNLVPIRVDNVIAHGGEGGIRIGVVTRLTEHKIEMEEFCVDLQHINGEPWGRENYFAAGYYWSKTMLNSADRCMVLPLKREDLITHFTLAHRLGEVMAPALRLRNVTEIPSSEAALLR